jgi:cell division protein FtsN
MSSNTEGPRTTRSAAKPQGRGLNPMFIGIIIGLLLGMVIALAVAYFVSRNSGSANVADKVKQPEPLAKAAPPSGVSTPSQRVASPNTPALKAGEVAPDGTKPRFEFYDILPGDKPSNAAKLPMLTPKPAVQATPIAPPVVTAATPAAPAAPLAAPLSGRPVIAPALPTAAPVAIPSGGGPNYALQAGAFQNESDAESLKAKIAFAGYEATVRPVNVPDKGTLYRVRLGTYRNIEEVNRVRAALAQNGITASVVKVE